MDSEKNTTFYNDYYIQLAKTTINPDIFNKDTISMYTMPLGVHTCALSHIQTYICIHTHITCNYICRKKYL